jgi:hypothetical protein
MRLSEISTDRAADVLCEITTYVANIVTDEDLIGELKKTISGKAITRAELIALATEKINKLIPIVLKKRKADVFGILAVLNEKTVEEIGKQNFLTTMRQVKEIVKDRELLDFFKSCAATEGNE